MNQAFSDHFSTRVRQIAGDIQSGRKVFVKRTNVVIGNQQAGQLKPRFGNG